MPFQHRIGGRRRTRGWLKHGAAPVAKRSTLRLTFLQSPQVHNFYFCGFGVRPGPANCNLTGIYDDWWALGAGYKGVMSDISTKYDKMYRYMLKSAMAKYILYGN
jgi:hypothetical protein